MDLRVLKIKFCYIFLPVVFNTQVYDVIFIFAIDISL